MLRSKLSFCRAIAALCTLATLAPIARAQNAPVIAPLPYEKRTLANGLTVLSAENHNAPRVAVYVWYKVGGKNDPPGRSGFAHLFEHMMFKATRNQPSENFDRLTEDVGGENNAYTDSDVTVYHETVPSNYLEPILWAEADRMANLDVVQATFASERDVVKEEYRQRILASPYGRLSLLLNERSFTTHPYKRDTIGSISDLDNARLADVRAFHSTFYRPDNATLVVAGDFDTKQLNAWVDRYFGPIVKPKGDIPRVAVQEPPRTGEKRFTETAPNVPLPVSLVTYLTPGETSADAPALQILSAILAGGASSRLYNTLVYTQQIASSAGATADLRQDAGLFALDLTVASGKTLDLVEQAALAEIERVKTAPITGAELIKAKNQLVTDLLQTRETADGTAAALGRAHVLLGDAARVNTEITLLEAVTPAAVQRVAQKYLTAQNRVVVRYVSGPAAPSAPAKPTPTVKTKPVAKPKPTVKSTPAVKGTK